MYVLVNDLHLSLPQGAEHTIAHPWSRMSQQISIFRMSHHKNLTTNVSAWS